MFLGLFNKFYFKEDHWRTKFGLGYGNINFQTYFDFPPGIPGLSSSGTFIDYNTKMAFVYGKGTRLVVDRLYLGLRMVYSAVNTEFDSKLIPDENLHLFGFGLASEYDKRDNIFNPHTKFNTKINTFSFLEKIGSTDTYHNVNIVYNQYFPVSDHATILACFFC